MLKFLIGVRRGSLYSVAGLALLIGGCPQRQTARRVVYVPSPPPSANVVSNTEPSADGTETLMIQEPEVPTELRVAEPEEEPPAPAPTSRRRRSPEAPASTAPVEPPPEPAEVPALQPGGSPQQQVALRGQITGLQQFVRQRIAQLEHNSLSGADRKTLEDARTFLTQSGQALEEGDLQRSSMLAQKARLLIAALDQGH